MSTALALSSFSAHGASEPIRLHYIDRPPYAVSQSNEEPTGVVASRASRAFNLAKIPFAWVKTPVNRQFALIKQNAGQDCVLGVEKLASRTDFAKFTDPLYVSQPVVALTNLKITEKEGVTLRQLLKKYRIFHRETSSLSDEIVTLINQSPNAYVTTIDTFQTAQLISHGDGDFMLISKDLAEYYIKHRLLNPNSVRILSLPDLKARFNRRIMCCKKVDDSVIERLNQAIQKGLHDETP